jgi:hypothetical protein
MALITQAVLAKAAIAVNGMGMAERVRLADEVFAHQPNLLASVLVLQRMGASLPQMDVPIHILLVAYQAMKTSGHTWPVISEDTQEACLQRLTGRVRFAEGLTPELLQQLIQQYIDQRASDTCSRSRSAICAKTTCSQPRPRHRSTCCLPP